MNDGSSTSNRNGHMLGSIDPPARSADEIRQRRLAAVQQQQSSLLPQAQPPPPPPSSPVQSLEDDQDLQAALALSLQPQEEEEEIKPVFQESGYNVVPFHEIMWDNTMTTDNDKTRWIGQGINTSTNSKSNAITTTAMKPLPLVGSDFIPWGLTQVHGGPCGVLAAVQAELLRLLLFGRKDENTLEYPTELPTEHSLGKFTSMPPQLVSKGLAMSIAIILSRANTMPPATEEQQPNVGDDNMSVALVLPITSEELQWSDLEPWSTSGADAATRTSKLKCHTISIPGAKRQEKAEEESCSKHMIRLAHATTDFLLDSKNNMTTPIEAFSRPGGVMLLVMSLVASRGISTLKQDIDDPIGTRLTSQFGHCSQELINLLLTGQAVSNVFDNTLTPSGGALVCRGIQSRSAVGYLSQLESLRYCQVGSFYKSPTWPIWVVGSTSHFTVLFGSAKSLQESKSDLLLEKCRRAFKSVDGGEENGYIATKSLGDALQSLDLNVNTDQISTLAATMEVGGAGIILWDDFWKASSRLLTGASIESVLQEDGVASSNDDDMSDLPLLITQNGEPDNSNYATSSVARAPATKMWESDEEMARRLAAEWDQGADTKTFASEEAITARAPSPMQVDGSEAAMTDEEYARMLQAEFDSGVQVVQSPAAAAATPPANEELDQKIPVVQSDEKMAAANLKTVGMEFEQYGNSFPLYHYNGLRGGSLTHFCVTRLSADEAVGHSVALSQHSNVSDAAAGGGSGDLEDVIRTKWPSCTIDWLGKSPPYID